MSKVKIIFAVVCLIVAGGILYFTMFRGSGGGISGGNTAIWLKCTNTKCNAAYSLTSDEFMKLQGGNPMMMPGMQQSVKCQKCSQQSAYIAQKCEKCGEVFIMSTMMMQGNQDYPDRCPKCKYSNIEATEKSQK